MKVLIVNRYMSVYGGAETVIKELSAYLKTMGITNRILTLNVSDETSKICQGLDIVTPKEPFAYAFRSQGFWQSLGIIKEIRALRRLVEIHSSGFDIVNVHNFPASWVARGLTKPAVWMCNEVPDFYNNPKPYWALRLLRSLGLGLDRHIVNRDIGAICVADEYNAQKVRQRYNRESEVIPYGIEYDFFSQNEGKEEAIQKYNLKDNFVLLQVGMLSPEKNQLQSIQALDLLREEIPHIRLVLAGRFQSPYDQMLKRYISERNIKERVIFTGHINKLEVRNLYQACNIALFPVKSQGGWLAPFEALCAGRPIVVSSTMGAASLISRQKLGLVCDDLVKAVKTIHNDYAAHIRQAASSAGWIKDNLTWELFARRMLEVFKETLTKGV